MSLEKMEMDRREAADALLLLSNRPSRQMEHKERQERRSSTASQSQSLPPSVLLNRGPGPSDVQVIPFCSQPSNKGDRRNFNLSLKLKLLGFTIFSNICQDSKASEKVREPPEGSLTSPPSSSASSARDEPHPVIPASISCPCPLVHLSTGHRTLSSFKNRGRPAKLYQLLAAQEGNFICLICNFYATNGYEFLNHLDIHAGPRTPFLCPVCTKASKTLTSWRNHFCLHLTFRPFKCNHCEAGFSTSGELKRHRRYLHQ